MKIKKFSYFVLAAIAASALSAEINLPRIFSDDMLIQRQKPVKIWGTADANAAVDVEFAGAKKSAKAGKDGKWSVLLDPLEASREGRDMKFYENGKLSRTIKDVLVGEVWVLGGQSNMEMTYTWRNLKPEGNPDIRYFSNSAPSISETPRSAIVQHGGVRIRPKTLERLGRSGRACLYRARRDANGNVDSVRCDGQIKIFEKPQSRIF